MVLGFTVLRFDECKGNNKILQMQENDDNNSVLPLFFSVFRYCVVLQNALYPHFFRYNFALPCPHRSHFL